MLTLRAGRESAPVCSCKRRQSGGAAEEALRRAGCDRAPPARSRVLRIPYPLSPSPLLVIAHGHKSARGLKLARKVPYSGGRYGVRWFCLSLFLVVQCRSKRRSWSFAMRVVPKCRKARDFARTAVPNLHPRQACYRHKAFPLRCNRRIQRCPCPCMALHRRSTRRHRIQLSPVR